MSLFKSVFKDKQNLFRGLSALFSLQFVNMVLPLLMIPYLARVLGSEGLGIFAFFQAIAVYVSIVVEFGVEFSGTRLVSKNKFNKNYISDQFWGVFYIKLALIILIFFVFSFLQNFVDVLSDNQSLLYVALLMGCLQGLNINWFFLAIDKIARITYIDISSRCFAVGAILFAVDSEQDVLLIFVSYAIFNFIYHLITYFYALNHVIFKQPSLKVIFFVIRNSFTMLVFKSVTSFYTISNTILIGIFCPIQYVGFYSYAEKIIKALRSFLIPINKVVFTKVNSLIDIDSSRSDLIFQRSTLITVSAAFVMGIIVYLKAGVIVDWLLGGQYSDAVQTLEIMSALLPVVALSNAVGICWMVPKGMDWQLILIVGIAAVLNIILAVLVIPHFYHIGAAYILLVVEFLILILVFLYLYFSNNNPFSVNNSKVQDQ